MKIFYGWWVVCACIPITLYVAGAIFYGFTAFIDPLVKEFGWSYTQISFAASLRGLEMGILAPLVGFLVDHFASRKLMFLGVFFVGLGIILLGFTQSLGMLYVVSLIIAFGAGGCTSVVTMTAVANWFEKKVGIAMGIMASGFGASGLIIPLIVGLIDKYGWRTASLILGLGLWIIGIPLTYVIRNSPEECGYLPDGRLPESESEAQKDQGRSIEIGFKEAVKNRSFLFINLSEATRMMALGAVVTHIMPYLGSLGVSRTRAGLVAAAVPLLSIIGRFGLGWLCDRFNKKMVLASAYFLMAVGMLALSYAHMLEFLILFLIFFPIGFGGIMVLRGAIIREYFGRSAFGKLVGLMMGMAAMGGIVGPTFAGWVFDTTESYYISWLLLSILLGFAMLLILSIESKPTR